MSLRGVFPEASCPKVRDCHTPIKNIGVRNDKLLVITNKYNIKSAVYFNNEIVVAFVDSLANKIKEKFDEKISTF